MACQARQFACRVLRDAVGVTEAQAGTGHDIMSSPGLEYPHPRGVARAGRRDRRRADQAIRPDQPGGRISCQDQGRVARRGGGVGQPDQAMLLALRSLQGTRRDRSARGVSRRRIQMGRDKDQWLELGRLSRSRRETLQSRLSGRTADGPDQRLRRLGRRVVQCLWRRHGRRQGQHQDQFRRDPRGARVRQEADGCEFRPTFTPGTMPATTAGSFPARDRAS